MARQTAAIGICVLAVALSACATPQWEGTQSIPLVAGQHPLMERALIDGSWKWQIDYRPDFQDDGHGREDAPKADGEIQVFRDSELVDRLGIEAQSDGTSGALSADDPIEVRVVLEVFETRGGEITVHWLFRRV